MLIVQIGKEDRIREKLRAELSKTGNNMRLELSQRGKSLRDEQKQRLAELEKAKVEAEAVKAEKSKIKTSAEDLENSALEFYRQAEEAEKKKREGLAAEDNRKEATETFKKYDSNNNNLIEVVELQTRIVFDSNRDGVVTVEEAKYFLDENDQVDLESFITLAWPRIKPQLMMDSGLFKPPVKEDDSEVEYVEHDSNEITGNTEEAELANEEVEAADDGDDIENVDTEGEYEEEEDETGEGHVEQIPQETQTKPEYDDETKHLIEEANEARNQFSIAERELREIDTEIGNLKDSLDKDYGEDDEYAPLNGECFNYEDREYIYKLCPFDRAVQQPKAGGAETRYEMSNFVKLNTI